MISGVLLAVFFMQFLAITFDQHAPNPDDDGPCEASPAEIQARLLEFMLFSVLVGTASGLLIGKMTSDPIDRLAQAARRLAQGEHGVRVPPGGSHETRALAEAFNHLVAELHRAEETRRNLMADVSHELRTPLTVLESNLRAALDGVVPLDEAEVANLYGQTRHLIRLVNDLRELALAESGQLRLEKTTTDLNALVADTLQALEPLYAERGVELADTPPRCAAAQPRPGADTAGVVQLAGKRPAAHPRRRAHHRWRSCGSGLGASLGSRHRRRPDRRAIDHRFR